LGSKATCADAELSFGELLQSIMWSSCTQFHPLFHCTVVWSNNELGNKEMETRHWLLQVGVVGIALLLCGVGYKPSSAVWTKHLHLCGLYPVGQLTGLK